MTETPVAVSGLANMPVKAAQKWAAASDSAGFSGLVYEPRFTGGVRARAIAFFGEGKRPVPMMAIGTSRNLRAVLDTAEIRIASPPMSAAAVLPAETPPPAL